MRIFFISRSADTLFFPSELKPHNDNYSCVVIFVDYFSKHLWAKPMRSANATEVRDSLVEIIRVSKRICANFESDFGNEFRSKIMKKTFDIFGINHVFCTAHASLAERYVRYIKNRISRAMRIEKTDRWLDLLQPVVAGINSSYHRIIGTSPENVTKKTEGLIFNEMYKTVLPQSGKPTFQVNDLVRISLTVLNPFLKESSMKRNSFSNEIFIIVNVDRKKFSSKPVYNIYDLQNTAIRSIFYQVELQKVYLKDVDGYEFVSIIDWSGRPNGGTSVNFHKQNKHSDDVIFAVLYKKGSKTKIIRATESKIYELAVNDDV